MLLILLASALLTPLQDVQAIGAIQFMSPREARDLPLKGKEHGVVQGIASPPVRLGTPPGLVELQLTERPLATRGGCVRRRWNASFRHQPDAAASAATFSGAWSATEVALRPARTCPSGHFVQVNPGLSSEEALRELRYLRDILAGKTKVKFTCLDETASTLCRTPKSIRWKLAGLPAWAVTRREGSTEFWLGQPGQVATALSYAEGRRREVRIRRSIPAPF